MRIPVFSFPLVLILLGTAHVPAQKRYLEDFEFLRTTVAKDGAAVPSKKIDWRAVCKGMKKRFAEARSDVEHTKNVMALLAMLHDSHTGVTRTSVDSKELPSKWDGLYGGGLDLAWEDGRIVLRGMVDGHSLGGVVPLGSVLVAIAGEPAWLVMEREKRRITAWRGSSSDHSLFSSMRNRFLPFGERRELELVFVTPDRKMKKANVGPWGPGGKPFYPHTVELPDGLAWARGAVATMLKLPWCERVGYLRITGGMDRETLDVFHRAFDGLQGLEALLLDCRGMGGGGDGPAWEMVGRLLAKPVSNGTGGTLKPSGSWQFDGPVVMLQDETEVSSAETFTWAASETGRVVSVGRPTGGWAIIPRGYRCPSGLVDFRLGVTDRGTPIGGVHTEGTGWPPDVLVPYGPVFSAQRDPVRDVGLEVLHLLHAGVPRKTVLDSFQSLFAGDADGFKKRGGALEKKVKGWKTEPLARRVSEDLGATLAQEATLLGSRKLPAPDALGASRRFEALAARAKKARLSGPLAKLKKAVDRTKVEAAAQTALLELMDERCTLTEADRKAFLRRHGRTRMAEVAGALPTRK